MKIKNAKSVVTGNPDFDFDFESRTLNRVARVSSRCLLIRSKGTREDFPIPTFGPFSP